MIIEGNKISVMNQITKAIRDSDEVFENVYVGHYSTHESLMFFLHSRDRKILESVKDIMCYALGRDMSCDSLFNELLYEIDEAIKDIK